MWAAILCPSGQLGLTDFGESPFKGGIKWVATWCLMPDLQAVTTWFVLFSSCLCFFASFAAIVLPFFSPSCVFFFFLVSATWWTVPSYRFFLQQTLDGCINCQERRKVWFFCFCLVFFLTVVILFPTAGKNHQFISCPFTEICQHGCFAICSVLVSMLQLVQKSFPHPPFVTNNPCPQVTWEETWMFCLISVFWEGIFFTWIHEYDSDAV